jgi:hypothetical protein
MPITLEQAHELAEMLATIPDFPRLPAAIDGTADDLFLLFSSGEFSAALDFCHAIRRTWEKWRGTFEMCERYRELTQKPVIAGNAVQTYERPPIACFICADNGYYRARPDSTAVVWCTCLAADKLRAEVPDWLDLLNGRRRERPRAPAVTRAELPPIPDETPGEKWQRCPKCKSTGRLPAIDSKLFAAYCDCSIGRDLSRVEGRL